MRQIYRTLFKPRLIEMLTEFTLTPYFMEERYSIRVYWLDSFHSVFKWNYSTRKVRNFRLDYSDWGSFCILSGDWKLVSNTMKATRGHCLSLSAFVCVCIKLETVCVCLHIIDTHIAVSQTQDISVMTAKLCLLFIECNDISVNWRACIEKKKKRYSF